MKLKLIQLANKLDKMGLLKEANILDRFIFAIRNDDSYARILLSEDSQQKLKEAVKNLLPAGFSSVSNAGDELCHHITISLSSWKPELNPEINIGDSIKINVVSFGYSDKTAAVRVTTEPHVNIAIAQNMPHITVGLNLENDGKPKDSNQIENFNHPLNLSLTGTIVARPHKEKVIQAPQEPKKEKNPFDILKGKVIGKIMGSKLDQAQKTTLRDWAKQSESIEDLKKVLISTFPESEVNEMLN